VPAYGPQNDVTLKMPAFEWVHVQLHQQKGMISLSPPTICNSAQKTGLPYNIVRFPNGPLLRVPACFRGEWCSGGARKRVYVKYHLFWCIFPQLNSTHRCRVPAPDAISYNHSDIKQS
ncbi:hypothetical protein, partial [Escherichia coli]|uniref:hypothetical protein n=1 Tax=Escherichia coli TaxID=562 RepID=UPI001982646B